MSAIAIEPILGSCPGLNLLEKELAAQIAAVSRIVEVASNAVLSRQGTPPEALRYLLDGQVALTQTASDGSNAVIDVVHPVSSLALASVVTDQLHMMTAQAVKPSRLLEIPASPLRRTDRHTATPGRNHAAGPVGGCRGGDPPGARPEAAQFRPATGLLPAVPGRRRDRGTGCAAAALPEAAAGRSAWLPLRESVPRLRRAARFRRGNPRRPRDPARYGPVARFRRPGRRCWIQRRCAARPRRSAAPSSCSGPGRRRTRRPATVSHLSRP